MSLKTACDCPSENKHDKQFCSRYITMDLKQWDVLTHVYMARSRHSKCFFWHWSSWFEEREIIDFILNEKRKKILNLSLYLSLLPLLACIYLNNAWDLVLWALPLSVCLFKKNHFMYSPIVSCIYTNILCIYHTNIPTIYVYINTHMHVHI